ncbi:MAG: tyrosine-protein phosphatase [Propionibacteriaceae bacterium]|jgi:protein-tyrosine phosphatase|nr:tyrosine-protein phosphatase [Propionibacteriaceae bacterium]
MRYIRLPLENAYNVRDLGGYPCPGGVTRWNTFLRADGLSALSAADIDFLLRYGVRGVIDLRSAQELVSAPEPEKLLAAVEYFHIPLLSGDVTDATKVQIAPSESFLGTFYREIIKNGKAAIKNVIETIAAVDTGAVLFHCAAGKDRTGITAALLLGIAGVDISDIVANYEVTYTYIRKNPTIIAEAAIYPVEFLFSHAEFIEGALTDIVDTYGSIWNYLLDCGVAEQALHRIRERFIEN